MIQVTYAASKVREEANNNRVKEEAAKKSQRKNRPNEDKEERSDRSSPANKL